jgi:general secretion pathway protein N
MIKWSKILGLALLSCGTLMTGPAPKPLAATSATLDILSDDAAGGTADKVDIGRLKPISAPNREAAKPAPAGNPLWAVPLSVLTATQQRPIFSASRRPAQAAVVAPAAERVNEPVLPKAAEQEHPPLALIGAVVGDGDAIAVFVDRTNQKVVRLRRGETHAGWVLGSVLPREVTLRKADRTEILVLQRPEGPAGVPATPDAPGLVVPAAGGAAAPFAPFVPRSTPKHGEPDGL